MEAVSPLREEDELIDLDEDETVLEEEKEEPVEVPVFSVLKDASQPPAELPVIVASVGNTESTNMVSQEEPDGPVPTSITPVAVLSKTYVVSQTLFEAVPKLAVSIMRSTFPVMAVLPHSGAIFPIPVESIMLVPTACPSIFPTPVISIAEFSVMLKDDASRFDIFVSPVFIGDASTAGASVCGGS